MHSIFSEIRRGEQPEWKVVLSVPHLAQALLDPSLVIMQAGSPVNLHYSCHHVKPTPSGRDFESGEWLFFDVDGIENYSIDLAPKYRDLVSAVLKVPPESIWLVSSGRGVHMLVHMVSYDLTYLKIHQPTYKMILAEIQKLQKKEGLTGEFEDVFNQSKSLRLPGTQNQKRDKGLEDALCVLVQKGTYPFNLDLNVWRKENDPNFNYLTAQLEEKRKGAVSDPTPMHLPQVLGVNPPSVKAKYATFDEIFAQCNFMQWAQENMAYANREPWMALVSTLTALGVPEKAHEWSKVNANYNERETNELIRTAEEKDIQPMSCATVQAKFGAMFPNPSPCDTCTVKACKSPAFLHYNEVNRSMAHGFYLMKRDSEGRYKKTPNPDYKNLAAFINQEHNAIFLNEYQRAYVWNGEAGYKELSHYQISNLFNSYLDPVPSDPTLTNRKAIDSLATNFSRELDMMLLPENYLPLQNGILNLTNKTLEPYDPRYFVTHKMGVSFDPTAKAPKFEEWLLDRTGDKENAEAILQFFAYALMGTTQPNRRILVLEGPGATGKSTLIETMRRLFGELSYLSDLSRFVGRFETYNFIEKRLVIFDEAISDKSKELFEKLKSLSGMPTMTVEQKGEQPIAARNTARLVIACNEIPRGGATDSGLMDRLLIVPWNKVISTDKRDPVEASALFDEAAGILNLLIERIPGLIRNRLQIHHTKSTQEALDKYELENNNVLRYIDDELIVAPGPADIQHKEMARGAFAPGINGDYTSIELGVAYSRYSEWCERNGELTMSKKFFAKGLRQGASKQTGILEINFNRKVIFYGLKFHDYGHYEKAPEYLVQKMK